MVPDSQGTTGNRPPAYGMSITAKAMGWNLPCKAILIEHLLGADTILGAVGE